MVGVRAHTTERGQHRKETAKPLWGDRTVSERGTYTRPSRGGGRVGKNSYRRERERHNSVTWHPCVVNSKPYKPNSLITNAHYTMRGGLSYWPDLLFSTHLINQIHLLQMPITRCGVGFPIGQMYYFQHTL